MADYGTQSTEEDYEHYEFVSDIPNVLNCQICLLVMEQPLQHVTCSKLFCKVCLDEQPFRQCPNCRTTDQRYFEDTRADLDYGNLEFVSDPPDTLKCLICLSVVKKPLQHVTCGKLFCNNCLAKHQKRSTECPNCRTEDGKYFKDTKSNREVYELEVYCMNHDCDWKGELNSLKDHLNAVCPYSMISCPDKCLTSDGEMYKCLRKDIDQHLKETCPMRKFQCPHCKEMGTYEERTTTHLEECPMVPRKCPNEGCNKTLPAFEIDSHVRDDCDFTVLECKYKNAGCNVSVIRKDLEEHESDDKLHLQVVMKSMAKQQEQLDLLRSELRLKRVSQSLNGGSITFKITDYMDKRFISNRAAFSSSFYTTYDGYHLKFMVSFGTVNKGELFVAVYARIEEGRNDHALKWPFKGLVTVELLNQVADVNHCRININLNKNEDAVVGTGLGEYLIPQSKLYYDLDTNAKYLEDDTLYFRVKVQVPDDKPWLKCDVAN